MVPHKSQNPFPAFLSSIFTLLRSTLPPAPTLLPNTEAGEYLAEDFLGSSLADNLSDGTEGTPKLHGYEFWGLTGPEQGDSFLQGRGGTLETLLMAGIDGRPVG